jgi:SAM-dependent methyltransferase
VEQDLKICTPDSRIIPYIDYDHERNQHSIVGARTALERFFMNLLPRSILDVGCGKGTWLRAALDLGVQEIYGIDGVLIDDDALLVPRQCCQLNDLSQTVDLGRKFDLVLCLEVAEHLPANAAPGLIATLVAHSDLILFSAAAPGQRGQHHVNCQWPSYWQNLFNAQGYACDDGFRWDLWAIQAVEPWYRQNIFVARRASATAGREARINPVIHPEMLRLEALDLFSEIETKCVEQIEAGSKSLSWYAWLFPRAVYAKVRRRVRASVP